MTESARGDVLAWVGVSYPLRGNKGLVDKTWRRRRLVCGRRSNLGVTTMVSDLGPPVMVNGLPGNMATEVAEAVLRRGLRYVIQGGSGGRVHRSTTLTNHPAVRERDLAVLLGVLMYLPKYMIQSSSICAHRSRSGITTFRSWRSDHRSGKVCRPP